MSEKVKLTMEQAEAVENTESRYGKDLTVIRHAERYFHDEEESRLTELTTAEVAKALYIGYEVEETFEVGDWVIESDTGRPRIIVEVTTVNGSVSYGIEGRGYLLGNELVRHATHEEIAEEKQRGWWAKHGREVWELKENDILYYDDEFKEVEEVSEIGAIMLSSERVYLPLETIKSKYSVACFADDRKDIDGGDNE